MDHIYTALNALILRNSNSNSNSNSADNF